MYLEAVFRIYVLLNHFVGHAFLGLVFFGSFSDIIKPKERVTYKMIKEYIEAKYGFKVHTAYIAEVKRDLGLPMYDAPNAVEELKQPRKHPTAEKVEAIRDALKHFEVI